MIAITSLVILPFEGQIGSVAIEREDGTLMWEGRATEYTEVGLPRPMYVRDGHGYTLRCVNAVANVKWSIGEAT